MIKYECDICGGLNVPAETYGPGVIATDSQGKAMVWQVEGDLTHTGDAKGIELYITPVVAWSDKGVEGGSSHTCGACIKMLLMKMIEAKWPGWNIPDDPKEVNHDIPDSDGADPDVREVRAEPEVQGSSTTESELCQSCARSIEQEASNICLTPAFHRVVRSSRGGPREG